MSTTIRVLVVDDSPTARAYLVEVLGSYPGVTVVGEAADGKEAVEATAELQPSVVVMDAVMPVMDGFEATERIMIETPTPVVMTTAALDPDDVALALRSVEVGALAVLPKPTWDASGPDPRAANVFARKVVALSGVGVIRRYRESTSSRPIPERAALPDSTIHIVGVAASTGGPRALHDLLAKLPDGLAAPVLIVQHIAEGFVDGLVRWLDAATALQVKVAERGEPLTAGQVYLAPDDHHLRVAPLGRVHLDSDPPIGGFRPAATALFESLAGLYGTSAAGVILSGLGDDGLAGLLGLRAAGGTVLAQDEETAAVFGMPGVVVAAGIAHVVGSVDTLAAAIAELTTRGTA